MKIYSQNLPGDIHLFLRMMNIIKYYFLNDLKFIQNMSRKTNQDLRKDPNI